MKAGSGPVVVAGWTGLSIVALAAFIYGRRELKDRRLEIVREKRKANAEAEAKAAMIQEPQTRPS